CDHVDGRDGRDFAPSSDGDPALLGINCKDQLFRPDRSRNFFRKHFVGLTIADERGSEDHTLCTDRQHLLYSLDGTHSSADLARKTAGKLTNQATIVAGAEGG